jgi:hypothetical protein
VLQGVGLAGSKFGFGQRKSGEGPKQAYTACPKPAVARAQAGTKKKNFLQPWSGVTSNTEFLGNSVHRSMCLAAWSSGCSGRSTRRHGASSALTHRSASRCVPSHSPASINSSLPPHILHVPLSASSCTSLLQRLCVNPVECSLFSHPLYLSLSGGQRAVAAGC